MKTHYWLTENTKLTCSITQQSITDHNDVYIIVPKFCAQLLAVSKKGLSQLPFLFRDDDSLLVKLVMAINAQQIYLFSSAFLNNNLYWVLSEGLLSCNQNVNHHPYVHQGNGLTTLEEAKKYSHNMKDITIFHQGKLCATGQQTVIWTDQ